MGQPTKRHIGRILLDGGFLQHHELDCALEEQKHTKELLGQVLIRKGILKTEDVKVPLIIQEHLGTIENAVKIAAGERQLLGALLVQSGHITSEQLDNVIAEQQRCGEKLGEVLKRLAMLTELQLNALLDFQRSQEGAHASPLRLGELLVATGRVTREHLEDALSKQTQSKKRLGDVLVEAGYARPSCIEYGLRLQKMLLKAVLAAILSLAMNTGSAIAGTAYAEKDRMCEFSKQIQSSPMRGQYIADVIKAKEGSTLLAYNTIPDKQVQSDASEDFSFRDLFLGKERSSFNQGENIDPLSKNCLTCHDGGAAKDITVDYRNTPGNKTKHFDGTKQHPIGMDYDAYSARDSADFKPVNAFNSKMVFVNGKVGCTTCHNPLNPEKNHLVMSDFRSALCLTCHKK